VSQLRDETDAKFQKDLIAEKEAAAKTAAAKEKDEF
jgi:hypothetical protein